MPSSEPEAAAEVVEDAQRIRRSTGALERGHQRCGDRFFQRVFGEQRAEISDDVGRTTLGESSLGQRAAGQEVAPLEPLHLDIDEHVVEVGERSTPAQAKRPLDERLADLRVRPASAARARSMSSSATCASIRSRSRSSRYPAVVVVITEWCGPNRLRSFEIW